MLYYSDIQHPNRHSKPLLDVATGRPLNVDTLSSGELAFASIAKAIVDHGCSLDWVSIEELKKLLDMS
jgi:hypothetical protein